MTDKQTNANENITFLAEVMMSLSSTLQYRINSTITEVLSNYHPSLTDHPHSTVNIAVDTVVASLAASTGQCSRCPCPSPRLTAVFFTSNTVLLLLQLK